MKMNQQLSKFISCFLSVLFILLCSGQSVLAQDLDCIQKPIEFIDENGEVMAVFIPY